MADFVIPKGMDFEFQITVKEKESFIAQDLTNMNVATFNLLDIETQAKVATSSLTVIDALNGVLGGILTSSITSGLTVYRGSKEDGYYLKPGYQGSITITFTDSTESINVLISKIYIAPTGE